MVGILLKDVLLGLIGFAVFTIVYWVAWFQAPIQCLHSEFAAFLIAEYRRRPGAGTTTFHAL
jgi:hypothetical protein